MNPTEAAPKRAIVTGGCSGLGAACVTRPRADGMDVLTLDVSREADIRVDITDTVAVAELADEWQKEMENEAQVAGYTVG